MKKVILFASLLVFPYSALAENVFLVENSTEWEFDEEKARDVYHRIAGHLENLGLELSSKPRVRIHLVGEDGEQQVHTECLGGGCGHLLRIRTIGKKQKKKKKKNKNRVAIVGISSKGIHVWLTKPDFLLLAQALTVSLDYENHLYMEPPTIVDVASTAWRTHSLNEKWKVTAQALQKRK